jgi:hypothetical protein
MVGRNQCFGSASIGEKTSRHLSTFSNNELTLSLDSDPDLQIMNADPKPAVLQMPFFYYLMRKK